MISIHKTVNEFTAAGFTPASADCATDEDLVTPIPGSLAYIAFEAGVADAIETATAIKKLLDLRGVKLVEGGIETMQPSLTIYVDMACSKAQITLHNIDDAIMGFKE